MPLSSALLHLLAVPLPSWYPCQSILVHEAHKHTHIHIHTHALRHALTPPIPSPNPLPPHPPQLVPLPVHPGARGWTCRTQPRTDGGASGGRDGGVHQRHGGAAGGGEGGWRWGLSGRVSVYADTRVAGVMAAYTSAMEVRRGGGHGGWRWGVSGRVSVYADTGGGRVGGKEVRSPAGEGRGRAGGRT